MELSTIIAIAVVGVIFGVIVAVIIADKRDDT
jgi:ABC-type phosphate/phosphonate transport system permease subunit